MKKAQALLQKYWGYPSFRLLQEKVISAVLAEKDVLALMPTGGGKSLCFQIPALLLPHTTLVISPLIALMEDQVQDLKKRGIGAEALHAGIPAATQAHILSRCAEGKIKLLYLSPERLSSEAFKERLTSLPISFLAVDEAHCISQWGHDFRPAYQKIASLKKYFPTIPILAVTATATPEVQEDIKTTLQLRDPEILKSSFARDNLCFSVTPTEDKNTSLYEALSQTQGSTIVYAPTRRETQYIAEFLAQHKISTTYYHAGLSSEERIRRQQAWLSDAVRVIVATNAFGMGINKPNVRLVVHLHFPETLEAYYQEAGRAGRDGKLAYAKVFYEPQEPYALQRKVSQGYPDIKTLQHTYQRLANYYQIAIGSHPTQPLPFDIEDFAHTYRIGIPQLYTLLQRLEEAPLIRYQDHRSEPTKVHITAGAQQLYAFSVQNPPFYPLIQALNHVYGTHIFSGFTPISLPRLAKKLKTTPEHLHQQLTKMDYLTVLSYQASMKTPTLTFMTPRYPVANLPLSKKKIENRKKAMIAKAQHLIHYMTHPQRCRMQLLLEYFGEVSYTPCQQCDRCKPQQLAPLTSAQQQVYKKKIQDLLAQHTAIAPKDLIQQLGSDIPRQYTLTLLEEMIATEEVKYNKKLLLTRG